MQAVLRFVSWLLGCKYYLEVQTVEIILINSQNYQDFTEMPTNGIQVSLK